MIDTVEAREKSGSETLVPLEKSQSQYAHVSVKSIQAQKGTEKSKGDSDRCEKSIFTGRQPKVTSSCPVSEFGPQSQVHC
jgi:hypothetical protein